MRKHSSTVSSSSSDSRSHSSSNEGLSVTSSTFTPSFFFPPSDPLSRQDEASEEEASVSLDADFAPCLSDSSALASFFRDEELLLCFWPDDRLDELW